jgi:hypothetical protein
MDPRQSPAFNLPGVASVDLHSGYWNHNTRSFVRLSPAVCTSINITYFCSSLFGFLGWGETVHLVRRPLFGLLYQPRMMDDDECVAVDGMSGRRSTWRKYVSLPLRLPHIPHNLTWVLTRAAAVGSRLSYSTALSL